MHHFSRMLPILFFLLLVSPVRAQSHLFAVEGSQITIQPILSAPSMLLKTYHPDVGHFTFSNGFRMAYGLGAGLGTSSGFGINVAAVITPMDYEVLYRYIVFQPDPFLPEFSHFQQSYLNLQLRAYQRLWAHDAVELGLTAGLETFVLARHRDNTLYHAGNTESDRLRDNFQSAITALSGGLEFAWVFSERWGIKGTPLVKYFPKPISNLVIPGQKQLVGTGQIALLFAI